RRPLLIGCDLGRALLLCSIPGASLLGMLSMEQLYLVALLTGALSSVFEVANVAYLPSLIRREELIEGNSKLAASAAAAEVGAFPLGGLLVQLFTAPVAVLIDALSFVLSAVFIAGIKKPEPVLPTASPRHELAHEIMDGLRQVVGDRVLRSLAA